MGKSAALSENVHLRSVVRDWSYVFQKVNHLIGWNGVKKGDGFYIPRSQRLLNSGQLSRPPVPTSEALFCQ